VSDLEIRERLPSTLRNVDGGPLGGADGDPGAATINVKNVNGGPLGGAGAGDSGALTINAKKHRWQAPWEVPELEIWERPPSTLRNVDGGPPGRCRSWGFWSTHHQC
jgi:hypothetical protein